ncbi:MAG: SRPBCC family protein [Byssovorax sp.]
MNATNDPPVNDNELVVSRLFDAPPELVFSAWTDPRHLLVWFGPKGFTLTTESFSFKEGGAWVYTMHGMGKDWPNYMRFTRIVPGARIELNHGTSPDDIWFDTVITFTREGEGTRLVLKQTHPTAEKAAEARKYAVEGGNSTLERLAEYLPAMDDARHLVIERVFDAPRELVYAAFTKAEHLARWWGPKGFSLTVKSLDVRPGGRFHYAGESPTGQVMWGVFDYLEVVPNERLVYTNSFSDEAGGITRHPMAPTWPAFLLNRVSFLDEGKGTKVVLRGFPLGATAEEIAMFEGAKPNVQGGFKGTMDQLDEYLKSL